MSLLDDLRDAFLTRGLTDDQRAELIAAGEERAFETGDELFHEGRAAEQLWILLSGDLELTRRIANRTIVVTTMTTPGQWAGGFTAWGDAEGHAVYRASGRAVAPTRCLVIPSESLGSLLERWSPFATHMIRGVFQTVRGIDAMARERESLVALGTLAAGLAHEINNPASATMRAVDGLRDANGHVLSSLVALAQSDILAEQFLQLDQVRVELMSRPPADSGALVTSDREERIGRWMDDRGIESVWQIAPVLATRAVDTAWLDALLGIAGDDAIGPALRWVSATLESADMMDELTESTARISHLVADVKTYSQMDRADLQQTDLHEGLESTLAILHPKLEGIEIVRTYGTDIPQVEVFAAELNQVWTNLIENALDAMADDGTLELTTRLDEHHVIVEITDSGPGIPVEVRPHVFEPFFTTKDVGKGTGLGLDIVHRIIVDRHGGDIDLDSRPGRTTAIVRLPRLR